MCEYTSTQSRILETRFGPGISQIDGDFEEQFFELADDWLGEPATPPVLLSGMVGSTIGWKDAPYLSCPVSTEQIADGRITFEARGVEFSILAGLRNTNPLGSPDLMRGEELQLLGWLRSQATSPPRQLFALPGTHNKWALCKNGEVSTFLTAYTGELFALLRNHSILISDSSEFRFDEQVFLQGVKTASNMDDAQLIHTLFSTRAKQVVGDIAAEDALSYLSGLIISADISGALALFKDFDSLTIIGESSLSKHYELAANHYGVSVETCDPSAIAIAGFAAIYQQIFARH